VRELCGYGSALCPSRSEPVHSGAQARRPSESTSLDIIQRAGGNGRMAGRVLDRIGVECGAYRTFFCRLCVLNPCCAALTVALFFSVASAKAVGRVEGCRAGTIVERLCLGSSLGLSALNRRMVCLSAHRPMSPRSLPPSGFPKAHLLSVSRDAWDRSQGLGPVIPAETVLTETTSLLFERRSLAFLALPVLSHCGQKQQQRPGRISRDPH